MILVSYCFNAPPYPNICLVYCQIVSNSFSCLFMVVLCPYQIYLKVEFNSTGSISRKLIFPYFVNPLHSAPMVRMNALVYATCFADAARWECAKCLNLVSFQ